MTSSHALLTSPPRPVVGAVHRRSLHDEVVEKLGQSIVSGVFAEGANLPNEADLAADLGVSRNVLREAVKVLVVELKEPAK